MRKLGFTLIELMVAVAIMGILTSIAAPKIFEYVVKAKASELSPAAQTYTKLQSAYLYEYKTFGTWKKIGYESPGGKKAITENFRYSKGDVTGSVKAAHIQSAFAGDGKVVWEAENRVGLGNCHIGNRWKIKVVSISDHEIEYRPYLEPTSTSNACKSLAKDWGDFQTMASLNTPPANHSYINKSSSSSEAVVAGGSTPSYSSASIPEQPAAKSSSSATTVAFYDAEENFTDEDDGSCGVMYTSNGDRCPPSWCKLNGNVSRNHGGWGNNGHKWNECYAARQELISIASDAGQVNCKNKNVCKVTDEGKELVINSFTFNGTTFKGLVISRASEEISASEYESGEFSSSSATLVYNGKGRENAEQALGEEVMCATDNNDASCKQWRPARECTYPSRDNTSCISW